MNDGLVSTSKTAQVLILLMHEHLNANNSNLCGFFFKIHHYSHVSWALTGWGKSLLLCLMFWGRGRGGRGGGAWGSWVGSEVGLWAGGMVHVLYRGGPGAGWSTLEGATTMNLQGKDMQQQKRHVFISLPQKKTHMLICILPLRIKSNNRAWTFDFKKLLQFPLSN